MLYSTGYGGFYSTTNWVNVSTVISELRGYKFLYIILAVTNWQSSNTSNYWWTDLTPIYRYTYATTMYKAAIVVSDKSIASINSSGSSSGSVGYNFASATYSDTDGKIMNIYAPTGVTINWNIKIYSA